MIGSVNLHDDVAAQLEYVTARRDHAGRLRPEVVALGGSAGRDFHTTASIFRELARARPDIERPLASVSLSLAPGDRRLTDGGWRDVASRMAVAFGSDVWATWRHGHDHVHVVWSRVRLDRTLVDHGHDYRRCERVVREIEQAMGLVVTPSSPLVDPGRPRRASRPPAEDDTTRASEEAAWRAWGDSADAPGGLVPCLETHGVRLTLDEGAFCLVIDAERVRPLVRVLARQARREGARPPREREILRRLSGLDAAALDSHLADESEFASIMAAVIPIEQVSRTGSSPEEVVAVTSIDPIQVDDGMQARPTLSPSGNSWYPSQATPAPMPEASNHQPAHPTDDERRQSEKRKRHREALTRHEAEVRRLRGLAIFLQNVEARREDEWTRQSIEAMKLEIEWLEELIRLDPDRPAIVGAAGRRRSLALPAWATLIVSSSSPIAAPSTRMDPRTSALVPRVGHSIRRDPRHHPRPTP